MVIQIFIWWHDCYVLSGELNNLFFNMVTSIVKFSYGRLNGLFPMYLPYSTVQILMKIFLYVICADLYIFLSKYLLSNSSVFIWQTRLTASSLFTEVLIRYLCRLCTQVCNVIMNINYHCMSVHFHGEINQCVWSSYIHSEMFWPFPAPNIPKQSHPYRSIANPCRMIPEIIR